MFYCIIKKTAIAFLLSASAVAAPIVSLAETTATSFSGPPATYGYSFTTNASLLVTALGVFDSDQDGLGQSHFVGIWDLGENLLASVVVPSGTGATLVDNFRYASIAPLFLAAGQTYVVGAFYSATLGDDGLVVGGTTVFDPAVTFGESRFVEDGVPAYPSMTNGVPGSYFGPSFDADVVAGGAPELNQGFRLPLLIVLILLSLAGTRASRSHRAVS